MPPRPKKAAAASHVSITQPPHKSQSTNYTKLQQLTIARLVEEKYWTTDTIKEFWMVYMLSVPNGVFYYFIPEGHTTTNYSKSDSLKDKVEWRI